MVAIAGVFCGRCGGCCRKCCWCCCGLLWKILKCIVKLLLNIIWALDGVLRAFVIEPIFVKPLEGFLERKRNQYGLTAEDKAIIDEYFVANAVGERATIRQYCCIFVPSSFCPCCFYRRVYVPHGVFLSAWLTEGSVENRTLKNVLCMIFCVFLAIMLKTWFGLTGSALFALFLCGIFIAWPTLRLTAMLFVVSLVHEDGRKVLLGLLHFYLLTVPAANIVHNSNSILCTVACTIAQALIYLADELIKGLEPFVAYLRRLTHRIHQQIREIIDYASTVAVITLLLPRRNSTRIIMPFDTSEIEDHFVRFLEEFDVVCRVHWKVDSLKPRSAVQRAFNLGRDAILRRLDFLVKAFRFFTKVHVCVTLYLMYKVTLYIYRFSRDMTFDNHYITAETEFRDMERRRQELPTILPLESDELMKFVDFKSLHLIWDEIAAMGGNMISVGLAALNFTVVHLVNLSMYSAAKALWDLVKYDGRRPMTPWESFIETLHEESSMRFRRYSDCLVEPLEPDWDHFDRSVVILSLGTILAVISPYIIRLRPLIASLYLPETASRRSTWLYRILLNRREISPLLAELAEAAKPRESAELKPKLFLLLGEPRSYPKTTDTIWNLPILWELTETFECVRCLSLESDYVLLFRCCRCERKNCNYCIYLNRDCGSCGAVMPYSPLGLEEDLIDMKPPPEIRAQRACV